MPKILVLGHGRSYKKDDIRCSPIPVDDWYHEDFVCIDFDPDINADIVYDLRKLPWSCIPRNSYSVIIDTCGVVFKILYKKERFLNEINRILKPNGIFYGSDGYTFVKTI